MTRQSKSLAVCQSGFSLLEVLVALVIMAMALGALYQSAGGALRGMSDIERRTNAALLASSLLELHPQVPPGGTVEQGVAPDGLVWRYVASPRVEAVGSASVAQPLVLYRVEVVVSWRERGRTTDFALVTLLPERPPAPPGQPLT